jgi:subtilisin family serine protease
MAFNVKIMPVKVIDEVWDFVFGSPNVGTDDVVARGIRYAADSGAQVINMSIGRTGGAAAVATPATPATRPAGRRKPRRASRAWWR